MPPGPTLDGWGKTRSARASGDDDAHQCRTPLALGESHSAPAIKGGIARATGSEECGMKVARNDANPGDGLKVCLHN